MHFNFNVTTVTYRRLGMTKYISHISRKPAKNNVVEEINKNIWSLLFFRNDYRTRMFSFWNCYLIWQQWSWWSNSDFITNLTWTTSLSYCWWEWNHNTINKVFLNIKPYSQGLYILPILKDMLYNTFFVFLVLGFLTWQWYLFA